MDSESFFPAGASLVLLGIGGVAFLAVNTGWYYSFLLTPYCLVSLDCWLELFASFFAYKSILLLIVDSFFLYLASRIASGFFKTRVLLATLLAGSALFLLYESLWMLQAGRVKTVVTGMGGGVAALWGLAASSGRPGFSGFVKILGSVRRVNVSCLWLAIVYAGLHALLGIQEQGLMVSTVILAVALSFATGYAIGVRKGKAWTGIPKTVYTVIVVVLVSTLAYLSISAAAIGVSQYENTQLVYTSYQCQLCYTVLMGGFEGCDSFKTRQTLILYPVENVTLNPEKELATGRIGLECTLLVEKTRVFNESYPFALTVFTALVILFHADTLLKKGREIRE
ncbi:MAG: hypothetical protein QXH45_06420 [Thermosphaera sp.]